MRKRVLVLDKEASKLRIGLRIEGSWWNDIIDFLDLWEIKNWDKALLMELDKLKDICVLGDWPATLELVEVKSDLRLKGDFSLATIPYKSWQKLAQMYTLKGYEDE